MSSVIPDSPSPQLQVVLQYFEAFASDIDRFADTLSEDLLHQCLPYSLEIPDWNKEELLMQVPWLRESLSNFNFEIDDFVESPGKVFIEASSTTTSLTGEPRLDQVVCTFRLKTDDSGHLKICEIRLFVDSKYIRDFFPADLARARESGFKVPAQTHHTVGQILDVD